MDERRSARRVEINLNVRWEGVSARHDGSLVDISATGCFLLTPDDVRPEELIRLEIELPGGSWVFMWGQVVYQLPEMGFALRFTGTDESEAKVLEELLEYAEANRGSGARPPSQEKGQRTEQRKKTRLSIPIEVSLDVLDESLKPRAHELTVTENISPRGAAVLTTLDVEVGTFLKVSSERERIAVKAIVRARSTGGDGIKRLHLEFLDDEWPLA